ncbi:MAG: GTPase ObgE, partial [Lachnospiraceae bacterium]|nr:GTPase ObgE [Lachnospiraceae bacterium]
MFADHAEITIISGKGGDGHVSFRREKYVAAGGPDGGDGGKGGSVIFEVDKGLNTLQDYRYKRKYAAEPGEEGGAKRCHGKNGKDIVLKVPEGTVIFEASSHKVITDMSGDNMRFEILPGGKGGKGNWHYATSTMQIPQYAEPGGDARQLQVLLELKCIADVGLVGYPNVGKSTLLSRVTNAKPKIADYHFTTLEPNLGVVDLDDAAGFVIADIPGLIEGAAEGVGLGHDFLRHIERTKVLIHVVDAASIEGRDPIEDILSIDHELTAYDADMSRKPQIIAANKLDLLSEEERAEVLLKLRDRFENDSVKVFPISAATGEGLKDLLYHVSKVVQEHKDSGAVFVQEYFPEYDVAASEPYTVSFDEKNNEY